MNSLFFRFISGFLIFLVVSSIGMCVSSYVTDMHMGHTNLSWVSVYIILYKAAKVD